MEYTIRPVRESDGKGLNALRTMPGVFENILGMPSERVGDSDSHIAGLGRDNHMFVAVAHDESGGEEIIGSAGIGVYQGRKRHSAGLGIMVRRDWQGRGVGSALLEAVLDIADNWLKLARVELTVFTDNERAIRLYRKYGFEEEGVRRMGAIRHGEYADELAMARIRL